MDFFARPNSKKKSSSKDHALFDFMLRIRFQRSGFNEDWNNYRMFKLIAIKEIISQRKFRNGLKLANGRAFGESARGKVRLVWVNGTGIRGMQAESHRKQIRKHNHFFALN